MNDVAHQILNDIKAQIEKNREFISKGGHKCDIPDYSEGYDMATASQTDDLIEIVKKWD